MENLYGKMNSMVKYSVTIWSGSILNPTLVNNVGIFDNIAEARKKACKYIGTTGKYFAKITNKSNKDYEYLNYSVTTKQFKYKRDTIDPKTGMIVRTKVKDPHALKSGQYGPKMGRYYTYWDWEGKVEFRHDNLNELRKIVLRKCHHTFVYVYDELAREGHKEIGSIEVDYDLWETPSGNYYRIKDDGSLGSRAKNPFE